MVLEIYTGTSAAPKVNFQNIRISHVGAYKVCRLFNMEYNHESLCAIKSLVEANIIGGNYTALNGNGGIELRMLEGTLIGKIEGSSLVIGV